MFLLSLLIFGLLTTINSMMLIGDNSPSMNRRILDGSSADRAGVAALIIEIPYLDIRVAFCSGFIITDRWVGTAAKCVFYADGNNFLIGVGSSDPRNLTTYAVMDVIAHENFLNETLANDIALLQTASAINFSPTVAAIPLQSDFFDSPVTVNTFGYGKTAMITVARCEICTSLLQSEFTVIPLNNCRMFFPIATRSFITDTNICSRHHGRATCQGDNGGPIIYNNRVIGITSWVDPCLPGQANVNTRISSYYDWIVERTGLIGDTTTTDWPTSSTYWPTTYWPWTDDHSTITEEHSTFLH